VDAQGRVYFIDHNMQRTTYDDPRLSFSPAPPSTTTTFGIPPPLTQETPLPPGWDMSYDYSGKVYFIDHANRTTTYNDPRLTNQNSASTINLQPHPTSTSPTAIPIANPSTPNIHETLITAPLPAPIISSEEQKRPPSGAISINPQDLSQQLKERFGDKTNAIKKQNTSTVTPPSTNSLPMPNASNKRASIGPNSALVSSIATANTSANAAAPPSTTRTTGN
jgi:hypothetical protein